MLINRWSLVHVDGGLNYYDEIEVGKVYVRNLYARSGHYYMLNTDMCLTYFLQINWPLYEMHQKRKGQ